MEPVQQIATPLSAIVEGLHYANQLHLQKQQAVTDTFQNLVSNGMKQDDALRTAGALHGYPVDHMQDLLQLPNEEGGRYGWRVPVANINADAKLGAAGETAQGRVDAAGVTGHSREDVADINGQYGIGRAMQLGQNQQANINARGGVQETLQQHAADLNAPYRAMQTAGQVSGETGGALSPILSGILDLLRQQGRAAGQGAGIGGGTAPAVPATPGAGATSAAPLTGAATPHVLTMPADMAASPGLNPKVQGQNDRNAATNATRITTTDMRDKTQTGIAKGHDAVLSRLGQERVDSYDHHTDLMYSAYLYRTDSDFRKAAMVDQNHIDVARIAHAQTTIEKQMTPQDKNQLKTLYSRLGSMQKQSDSADTNALASSLVNPKALGVKIKQIQGQIDGIYQKYGNVGASTGPGGPARPGYLPPGTLSGYPQTQPAAPLPTLQRQAYPNQTPPAQGPPRRRGPYRPSF